MSGAENVPPNSSKLRYFIGFSSRWPGEPLVPPFLYLPGVLLLFLATWDVLFPIPPPWGLRFLGVVETYAVLVSVNLLVQQNLALPAGARSHEYWRVRTVLWGLLATAITGLTLTILRGYPSLPGLLVPAAQFETTEIAALLFTISILAILARYTVMTSKLDTEGVAGGLTSVVSALREGFADLSRNILLISESLRARADKGRMTREGLLSLHAHVDRSGVFFHRIRLDVAAGPEGFSRCAVAIFRAGGSMKVRTLVDRVGLSARGPRAGGTFDLGDVSSYSPRTLFSVEAQWTSNTGTPYHGQGEFEFIRSGLFTFRLNPDFQFHLQGEVEGQTRIE